MRNLYTLLGLLYLGVFNPLHAQTIEIGVDYGVSSYFGDLAPFNVRASLAGGGSAKGIYLGIDLHPGINAQLNYSTALIQADDKNAEFALRKERNLHFRSPLSEVGLAFEIKPLSFFTWSITSNFQPFVNCGISHFRFNPQARYNGRWIDLQPLGTEGQGIPGYQSKYDLSQAAIPFGFGVKYYFNNNIVIGVGIKARMTFTDYLDDVSLKYADYDELLAYNGQLAVELSFRTDELINDTSYPTNSGRGNPKENDWYMSSYFTFGYVFTSKNINSFRKLRNIKCPGQ